MGNACSQTVDVVVVVVVNRSHIGSEWDKSGLGDNTKGLGAGKRGGDFFPPPPSLFAPAQTNPKRL